MKRTNKQYTLLFLLILFNPFLSAIYAQSLLPSDSPILGNWVEKQTGVWEYGFFEKFAIVDCNFWTYEDIKTDGHQYKLTLSRNNIHLKYITIEKGLDNEVKINEDNSTFRIYKICTPGFPQVVIGEEAVFESPSFKTDSVIIRGYYRNFEKIDAKNKARIGNPYFVASYFSFIKQAEEYHMTTIDSIGRFEVKIPLNAPQEIMIDWHRITRRTVFVPGETVLIYLDILDFINRPGIRFKEITESPRNIVAMGRNARLHNEQFNFRFYPINIEEKQSSFDDYFRTAAFVLKQEQDSLDLYISHLPTLSPRSEQVARHRLIYDTASILSGKLLSDSIQCSSDQISSLTDSYPINRELDFLLSRGFVLYAQNYLHLVYPHDPFRLGNVKLLNTCVTEIEASNMNGRLKELLIASLYYKHLIVRDKSLSKEQMDNFKNKVTTESFRTDVEQLQYELSRKESVDSFYEASIKDGSVFSKETDARELLNKIIAPYRGKVIYIDFWGTWCGPCKRQMQYAHPIKKELEEEDVIFLYLANASPQKQWLAFIKEMGLTGEQSVHYNLPAKQQSLLEQYLDISSFPGFILIDKDGNIADMKAPFPVMKEKLLGAIYQLLDK